MTNARHEHGIPGVASSDAHSVTELAVAYTVLDGTFSTAAELKALLTDLKKLLRLSHIG